MISSPMSSSKSSTIAPASLNITRQIKALVELHIKTMATILMGIKQENLRHIIMIAKSKTLVEAMDSSPTKIGAERRKMTANTTISTKTLAMNIRTLNVTSLMALLMVITRLAHSSTTNKPRGSHRLPTSRNRHLRAVLVFSQHTLLSASSPSNLSFKRSRINKLKRFKLKEVVLLCLPVEALAQSAPSTPD